METPETRYAKSGEVHIAYQVFGNGPVNLVYAPGFVSHIDHYWDEPSCARWLRRLGEFCRVVMFDKRGTGLSDLVPALPHMDERMDDLRTVMDAAGMDSAAVSGISEGGPLAVLFAATHPDRCRALVLYGAFAKFSSWVATDEAFDAMIDYIDNHWGSGESLPLFAPSRQDDPAFRKWWGKFERLGGSPAATMALMRMNREIDITDILPTVQVPTLVIHRTGDVTIDVEAGRLLGQRIPGARYVELPGVDHLPMAGDNTDEILNLYEEFLTGTRSDDRAGFDRVLSTVLFTDIVASTERAGALGDRRWRSLLDEHDSLVRRELQRFRGNEVKPLGDGFLATFDGPARAIRCALAIQAATRPLGIDIRAGLHTGEVALSDRDVRGIAVHIASRVAGRAGPGETLVSRTVKDLVAGSGLRFADLGTHRLKGVPDDWQLFKAVA